MTDVQCTRCGGPVDEHGGHRSAPAVDRLCDIEIRAEGLLLEAWRAGLAPLCPIDAHWATDDACPTTRALDLLDALLTRGAGAEPQTEPPAHTLPLAPWAHAGTGTTAPPCPPSSRATTDAQGAP